ncbi:TPA: hypothetical protein HA335_03700 [Methanocaldococcus jannaschii]|uniref:Uncharacterized protein MJ0042 n=2 Tax=Methanocaldococcus jannaschii TaxID=2190 RepID=Y042_METJA|nr:MJ0042-type zinc finger domain-containing protein [Methanocaldococcus jannaschii]Q60347.1 RecName: Full=Uncharacterized protein MJ0042 [Methanocaldococcus jannaschii DSM 2661]AAB98028.1 hypothetical protein MJ_0042 [Methanocaldococcus jannaschii DSM 2661]HII59673.1 hypothetical protein [Methanocaldococcus jannaschii]
MNVKCPECGAWIYVVEEDSGGDAMEVKCPKCGTSIYVVKPMGEKMKNKRDKDFLDVKILEIEETKKTSPYKDTKSEDVLKALRVKANINGEIYEFRIWQIAKKPEYRGMVYVVKSVSHYCGSVKTKNFQVDEDNDIYVKQKFGIIEGVNKSKIKLPKERMEEIAEKLGFELKEGDEGLRLYLGEKYSENPPLSQRPELIEKLIKCWIAFWEPTMI